MPRNTTPEAFEDAVEYGEGQSAPMSREETLMNEGDILAGMLALGNRKDEAEKYRKIQIKDKGVLKLEFRVRPLTEDEIQTCVRRANKYAPTKPGQPKRVLDTDNSKGRSYIIYTATVDEDRAKIWDNKAAQDALGIFQGVDMVDKILLAGEKSRVLDVIDEISEYDSVAEEQAKN